MNYYEHHLGDYAEATAHLSFVEDAAYSRLIRKYYASEKPLPAEMKAVQRLVGARTKEEKEAVETILGEFFFLETDGWHNARCDEEIANYYAKKPAAEEKRENAKERQRKARERRKALFEELSSLGVHMPWNATTEHAQAELSRIKSQLVTQPVTQPVTRDNTANQTPVPSHQTPVVKASVVVNSTEVARAPIDASDQSPTAQVCLGLKAMGYGDTNPHDFELAALLKAGMTPGEIIAVGKEFQGQGKRFRYLLKTAEGRRRDAAKVTPLPAKATAGSKTAEAAARWLESQGVQP